MLAKYFRHNVPYILVRNSGTQGMLFYVYDKGVYKVYAPEMVKGELKSFVAKYKESLCKMACINEAYQNLISDTQYISQDHLNADEDIINFQNGLFHLSTMDLGPHDPKILSTIQIPCNWTPNVPTPVFDEYISNLVDGDPELINLILEFLGVCISSIKGYRMKKALFLVGDGDTGKSQLLSLVQRLLGEGNYASLDLAEIEARFGTGMMYGTRIAGTADMSFLTVGELKTFKKITGGDSIFGEFKGIQGFNYTYNGVLFFCMNKLPKFGGDDGQWVYDRIMIINCRNVVPKDKQDKQLLDKMYKEREGIVYKAVNALQNVIQNGYRFSEPASVIDARDQYRDTNSSVISFFNDCMTAIGSGRAATTSKVFKAYKSWCEDNNNRYFKTEKDFREILADHLGASVNTLIKHTKYGNIIDGYTLSEDAMRDYRLYDCYDEDIYDDDDDSDDE